VRPRTAVIVFPAITAALVGTVALTSFGPAAILLGVFVSGLAAGRAAGFTAGFMASVVYVVLIVVLYAWLLATFAADEFA
jgi:hypothetical protein